MHIWHTNLWRNYELMIWYSSWQVTNVINSKFFWKARYIDLFFKVKITEFTSKILAMLWQEICGRHSSTKERLIRMTKVQQLSPCNIWKFENKSVNIDWRKGGSCLWNWVFSGCYFWVDLYLFVVAMSFPMWTK